MSYHGFRDYVPVAQRRALAARELEKLAKKGRKISPVVIEGRAIARNFWGKSWCDNLERYSDYANRLPRGRTYARNGSVVDLQIERGQIHAMVSGSELYSVQIDITTMSKPGWAAICADCVGSVGSLVELLQGKLSKNVMERVCRKGDGLFPSPKEIKMRCSCPDSAMMCKHCCAVLYGVGARLDAAPDVLFALRGVDRSELIAEAGTNLPLARTPVAAERILSEGDLAALFDIDMTSAPVEERPAEVAAEAGSGTKAARRRAVAPPEPTMTAPTPRMDRRERTAAAAKAPKLRKTRGKVVTTTPTALAPKPLGRKAVPVEPSAPPSSPRRAPVLATKWIRWKKDKAR